jgi:cellulose synthase/poly-beta-1,6-N-acetylglucosamine synthase-like glycosyltransferase
MMLYLAIIAVALALVFLGPQIVWAWRLAACYPPTETSGASDRELPRAAVVLSVRGADPSLVDCLQRLLCQDYADYELHVVIDSEHDPAWELVQPHLEEESAARVHRTRYPPRFPRKT